MNTPLLEGCVDSWASCMAAQRGGAGRLELCSALPVGGITPSPALFRQVRRDCSVKINVLIRPRFGDFLYTEQEVEQMCDEVRMFRDLGANGVVIGALTSEGELDIEILRRLIRCADGLSLTLHRAFDMTCDPFAALERAVDLGFQTILTSGQAPSAPEGLDILKALFTRAAGRIDIMAGCGVKAENIQKIYAYTGIRVFHTSGRSGPVESGMKYRRATVSMGLPSLPEYQLWQADEAQFRECAHIVHSLV